MEAELETIFAYDYHLGVQLPKSYFEPLKDTDKIYSDVIEYNYGSLPTFQKKLTNGSERRVEYEDVMKFDYVIETENSQVTRAIRLLEDLVEKQQEINAKLTEQNSNLTGAVLRLQGEKNFLLANTDRTVYNMFSELKTRAEEREKELMNTISRLSSELDKERMKVAQLSEGSGLLSRIFRTDERLANCKQENSEMRAEIRKLQMNILELEKQIESERNLKFQEFLGNFTP